MHLIFRVAFTLTVLASSTVAFAQGGGFLEQLMRDLLESQRQRQQESQTPPVVVGQPIPSAGASSTAEIRSRLQAFDSECKTLSKTLRKEIRRNRAVAPYLIEMVRTEARVDMLLQKYEKPQPDQVILADLQELDREWRNVSFRLDQIPALSDECTQSLGRMNQLCEACCSLFEVAPQVDRREIARLADSIAAELHHLERDIEYEVRQPRKARQFMMQVQRTEGIAKLIGEAAHQGDPIEVVIDSFQRYQQDLRSLVEPLSSLNNRRVDRSLAGIRELNRELRGILRIEASLDRDRLIAISNLTRDRVTAMCESISLANLIRRPNAAEIVAAAQQLTREADALCECVAASSPESDIAEHWRSLHGTWRSYDSLCQPIYQPRSTRFRQDVLASLDELRGVIGVQDAFDRRAVTRCAADLASVAGEAQHRVVMWSRRPGARVDAALIRQAQSLINGCQSLHERCVGQATQAELAKDCRRLAQRWSQLRPQLLACDTADQRVLRRLSDDASSHLIWLQGLLDIPAEI